LIQRSNPLTQTTSSKFNDASASALCTLLGTGGSAVLGIGAASMANGALVPGGAAVLAGGIAVLAYNWGCTWDPEQPSPWEGSHIDGCQEADASASVLYRALDGSWDPLPWGQGTPGFAAGFAIENVALGEVYPDGSVTYITTVKTSNSPETYQDSVIIMHAGATFKLDAYEGTCINSETPSEPNIPDYTYTSDDGCEINVKFLGFGVSNNGGVYPTWQMEPGASLRSDGGVIGGCNFAPTVYYQNPMPPGGDSPGGPTDPPNPPGPPLLPPSPVPPNPVPGPDGQSWWSELLREAAAGVAGEIIADYIKELFEEPVPAGQWFMTAPCNVDAEGNPEQIVKDFPEAKYQEAVLDRMDAIPEFVGWQLNMRTPTCNEKPELEGDYVTIEFLSDDPSPNGTARLRKLFRYRSSSGIGLGELADYWKDFTWSAGPVCVQHSGGSWGTPQCWASSGDEGKRLIRHAAAEAGIDPDQVGRWTVGGSDNPRFGMPGTMRVRINRGTYCITNRLGSNGRPLVVET